ncbi:MAG: hypothetical protein ACFFCD_11585 [Promethearchaeota archaeon]
MSKTLLSETDIELLARFFKALGNPIRLVGLNEILRGNNRLIDIAQESGKMIKKRKDNKNNNKFRSSDIAEHIKKLYRIGLAEKVGSSPKDLLYVPSNEKLIKKFLVLSLDFAELMTISNQLKELQATSEKLKHAKNSIKNDDLSSALSGSLPNLDKLIKEKQKELKEKTIAFEEMLA